MRSISGNDESIDRLLAGDTKAVFNLMQRIREEKDALLVTDGKSYLLAQTAPAYPMWLWLGEESAAQRERLLPWLIHRLRESPVMPITAQAQCFAPLLAPLQATTGLRAAPHMTMNVYRCRAVLPGNVQGMPDRAKEADIPIIKTLICQMVADAEGQTLPRAEAEAFAQAMIGADELLLWRDGGRVVAMAHIAHIAAGYARINTVVTERAQRGKGYAVMLMRALCGQLLAKGLTPMLYADAANPAANKTYTNVGFARVEQITEYRFTKPEKETLP